MFIYVNIIFGMGGIKKVFISLLVLYIFIMISMYVLFVLISKENKIMKLNVEIRKGRFRIIIRFSIDSVVFMLLFSRLMVNKSFINRIRKSLVII